MSSAATAKPDKTRNISFIKTGQVLLGQFLYCRHPFRIRYAIPRYFLFAFFDKKGISPYFHLIFQNYAAKRTQEKTPAQFPVCKRFAMLKVWSRPARIKFAYLHRNFPKLCTSRYCCASAALTPEQYLMRF
jgi:hypothetical protein